MKGFEEYTPQDVACATVMVHGWREDILIRITASNRGPDQATLHLLNSDHRLEDQIEEICRLLQGFLLRLGQLA
jgi:hypothetical protein